MTYSSPAAVLQHPLHSRMGRSQAAFIDGDGFQLAGRSTMEIGRLAGGKMNIEIIRGILIPFLGTVLGSACVFFQKNIGDACAEGPDGLCSRSRAVVAASIWSLLIPAMEQSAAMGKWSICPRSSRGSGLAFCFCCLLDHVIPHLHMKSEEAEGPKKSWQKSTMLVLAVTLHNIPEGMAVGVVFAGYMAGNSTITAAGALALAIGIAIQNFPEGAIISMPLRGQGMSKTKAFVYGSLSGLVEPIGALLTILAASATLPVLPYLLSFAAGAVMYVVVEELITGNVQEGNHSNIGTIVFAVGFTLMMALDVALG